MQNVPLPNHLGQQRELLRLNARKNGRHPTEPYVVVTNQVKLGTQQIFEHHVCRDPSQRRSLGHFLCLC
jgi:hypothetical protein